MLILDIDLDYFVNPILLSRSVPIGRADPEKYRPWSWDLIQTFVEINLKLDRESPLPGAIFENHVEAFDFIVQRAERGTHIVHVDAHSDLGQGGTSFTYICEELLHRAPDQRLPERRGGQDGLSSANWLAFLLAQQKVTKLDMVLPLSRAENPANNDIPKMYWRSGSIGDGPMELPILKKGGWEKWVMRQKHESSTTFEPPIQYLQCTGDNYEIPSTPNYVLDPLPKFSAETRIMTCTNVCVCNSDGSHAPTSFPM